MTDEELERMRAYAQAAEDDAGWGRAYAQDVPKLLAEVARMRLALGARNTEAERAFRDEIDRLGGHDLLMTEDRNLMEARWYRAEHRLRFAEMVLDRIGAEIDGVPWREAARLSESLEGEPVTEPRPGLNVEQAKQRGLMAVVMQWEATVHDLREPIDPAYRVCTNDLCSDFRGYVYDAVGAALTEPLAPPLDRGVQS